MLQELGCSRTEFSMLTAAFSRTLHPCKPPAALSGPCIHKASVVMSAQQLETWHLVLLNYHETLSADRTGKPVASVASCSAEG